MENAPNMVLFRVGEEGGAIERTGKLVEGSYKQNAWDDYSEHEHVIHFNGELTPEVCEVIRNAWNRHPTTQGESGWGRLRWSAGSSVKSIDVARRVLIEGESIRLCD